MVCVDIFDCVMHASLFWCPLERLLCLDLSCGSGSDMASLRDFIVAPSEELFDQFTKDQLLKRAHYYNIDYS